jgi:hypothetical protein
VSLHDLHVDGGDLAERIERDIPERGKLKFSVKVSGLV